MISTSSRTIGLTSALVLTAASLAGCAAQADTGSPSTSCSPRFEPSSKYGQLSVQQRSPCSSIQWGFYPNVPVAHFTVDVYVGSRRVDHKSQNYPPHGSVNVKDVVKGGTFSMNGEATNPKGDILVFGLRCRA
jgi:hypothetical protein